MSTGESKPTRRDRALKAARRRLRLLEIETHRIKAELARLEAEFEDDIADRLSGRLRRRAPVMPHRGDARRAAVSTQMHCTASSPSTTFHQPADGNPGATASPARRDQPPAADSPSERAVLDVDIHSGTDVWRQRTRSVNRRHARPMLLSLAVHALVLLFCLPLGFATLAEEEVTLLASPPAAAVETAEELAQIEFETLDWDDTEMQHVVLDQPERDVADNPLPDLAPLDAMSAADASLELGQADRLLSDLGTLMAGAAEPGSGRADGPAGSAHFFGTRSRGDRFVFVVDNSNSMSDGRLEAAVAELIASVDAMSPRQSFYVIFVSDRVYPMFHPTQEPTLLPATPDNKERLGDWLTRVVRAPGRNRELIKAMDLAASLQPQAVFFLWDGRIDHAGVRQDVMTHLTRPDQWNFVIHTLGMGVEQPASEFNLQAIAAATGGSYRRVHVPRAPAR